MEKIIISIANDFSKTPGPREKIEGDFSGESFREEVLEPKFNEALKENRIIEINLDGTFGYGTSFLEEAFGGLIRKYKKEFLKINFQYISNEEPYLIDDIKTYINDALNELKDN